MSYDSTKTIRADEARHMFGVSGEGIVWAVMDTGIHRNHVHFKEHGNLVLPPPLRHADFSAVSFESRLAELAPGLSDEEALVELAPDLSEEEALVDWHGRGTHTASIICGESRQKDPYSVYDYVGIAPKCKVLSLKIFPESGKTSERNILVALNWLKSFSHADGKLVIHGLNLNFSLAHDVDSFACGQTPVCEAINDLVGLGVVCVAQAGDAGYRGNKLEYQGGVVLGSIGDPGNAELAITVGSTHRRFPHEYGASYFSSRGPTMDGRAKPDLLAPGEKVTSCWINDPEPQVPKRGKRKVTMPSVSADTNYRRHDGTSVAATHVAGAAALLLSARPELIGRPLDVKGLLMQTAVDLKRASWMQGSGLVDVVRLLEAAQKPMIARAFTPVPTLVPATTDQRPGNPGDQPAPAAHVKGNKRFAIVLSFHGVHRELVKSVAFELRLQMPSLRREEILYDRFHEAELSRLDLDVYLPKLYAEECELVVVFLGGDYSRNQWCGLEWRAIREFIKKQQGQNIMPLRLDLTEIPGLYSTDGYMDVRNREPEEIAAKIIERLQINRQTAQRQR